MKIQVTLLLLLLGCVSVFAQDGRGTRVPLTKDQLEFINWQNPAYPYVISNKKTKDTIDTNFLKILLGQRLKTTYSNNIGPFTIKSLLNDGFFPLVGTFTLANTGNNIPVAPIPGIGEAVKALQIIYNLAAYEQGPKDPISLVEVVAALFDWGLSNPVFFYIVEPLAEVYEQVGDNARGMWEIHNLMIPTNIFRYVLPFWDVPDIKLLPIWITAGADLKAVPVDWMIAESLFDLAVFTLREAGKNQEHASDIWSLYRWSALKLKKALRARNDIDGGDLAKLYDYRVPDLKERYVFAMEEGKFDDRHFLQKLVDQMKRENFVIVFERRGESNPDKIDELYFGKGRIRETIYTGIYVDTDGLMEDESYEVWSNDGSTKGQLGEIFGGYVNCMVKDTIYASLMSEFLYLRGMDKKGEELDNDQKNRLRQLKDFRAGKVLMVSDIRDKYALTEKDRRSGFEWFTMRVCWNRFPNRYFLDWELGKDYHMTTKAYIDNLEKRVTEAQTRVQAYGNQLEEKDFNLYNVKGYTPNAGYTPVE